MFTFMVKHKHQIAIIKAELRERCAVGKWQTGSFRTVKVAKFEGNRSPKGNTWSAIPVALLCMVVNWNGRQGSGPEGDEVL